ncbi:MAG TPA: kelch repeat-containing protein [Gaiellaceae bacterium]|jgi:streptogramin lyase
MVRRTLLGGACAVFVLSAAVAASAGSGVRVTRAGGEPAPRTGRAWNVKLVVRPRSFHGVVTVAAAGPARIAARARGARGVYRARLVFPKAGLWRLTAKAGRSRSRLGSIRVRAVFPLAFDEPTGVAVEPNGSLLVVESGRHRLVRVAPSTGRVAQVAAFTKPWGVARSASGSIFVSDSRLLRRIDPGRAAVTVASADPGLEIGPVAPTPGGDAEYATATGLFRVPQGGGTPQRLAASTAFDSPHGIAIASDGAVLVSDTNDNRILRVDPAGAVTTFATLGHPRGIAVGPNGTVYVAAADEQRVARYSASGARLGLVGPRFDDVYALSVTADGTVYAIDAGPSGLVRRIPAGATSSAAGASTAARWGKAPRLPAPRSAHAVVVAAGAIHVLGGPGARQVERFDGRRWKSESRLPAGTLNAPAAVAIGKKIYVLGGFGGTTNRPTARVWTFDTGSKKWTKATPLPGARGGEAAVVLNGRIHVLGGGNDVSTLAGHDVYDPIAGTWSRAAPLPRSEGSVAAVVLGGKIWAIGGRSGFDDYGDTFVYDPQTDTWSRGPRIPPRGTAGAVAWKGSIYVFGGESQTRGSVLGDVFRLAPGATSWRRVGKLPTPRNYARSVVYRGRIYVVGGSTVAGDVHAARGSRAVEWFVPGT